MKIEINDNGYITEDADNIIKKSFTTKNSISIFKIPGNYNFQENKSYFMQKLDEYKGLSTLVDSRLLCMSLDKSLITDKLSFIKELYSDIWQETDFIVYENIVNTNTWNSIYFLGQPITTVYYNELEDKYNLLFLIPSIPSSIRLNINTISDKKFLLRLKGFLRDVEIY